MSQSPKNPELEAWLSEHSVVNKDGSLPPVSNPGNSASSDAPTLPSLDLHGLRVSEALVKLQNFLKNQPSRVKKILIIHGKGHHSENQEGVLKEAVQTWLRKHKNPNSRIKDFSLAKPNQGGSGATLVWLS